MKYSLWIDGKPSGPYDARQIQKLYSEGALSETDMVNPEGSKSWPMLKDVFPVKTWNASSGGAPAAGSWGSLLTPGGSQGSEVTLVGFNIPFWHLVTFLIKLFCAAFLAGLVFLIPYFLFWFLIIGMLFHR
ncbi:MAG: hypothetical protein WCH57_06205 [Verrucomicrobiota bacterium]